jgi:hypothetical protein
VLAFCIVEAFDASRTRQLLLHREADMSTKGYLNIALLKDQQMKGAITA